MYSDNILKPWQRLQQFNHKNFSVSKEIHRKQCVLYKYHSKFPFVYSTDFFLSVYSFPCQLVKKFETCCRLQVHM